MNVSKTLKSKQRKRKEVTKSGFSFPSCQGVIFLNAECINGCSFIMVYQNFRSMFKDNLELT